MSRMIKTAGNFQYSVNIAYDLQDSGKLRGFIPTKSSLELLEKIVLSTRENSTDRARILIGAYGKGKSHIVLAILSILKHHEPKSDFVHLNKKLLENPRLNQIVENYYESGKRLLPVLITGSGTSLTQSFLMSLKNSLDENDLSDLMPETNFKAAISTILQWKENYPDVLASFEKSSGGRFSDFVSRLQDFDIDAYQNFERIYPSLTAGSQFNPFLSFDVVELYESVAKELRRQKLYDGLYVVYDEFSKYLEANIESASVSDTKMLQDFAEKSCRSGENQLHLLLISHKEISNYIDKLPKQKTDGWRGISERFEHILLNNNFAQVYEIISTVIQKDKKVWENFQKAHKDDFAGLEVNYKNHELFRELKNEDGIKELIFETFPLHPVSTFILPRLSERIAQNERTLFTFLSAGVDATLPSFLKKYDDLSFVLVTPDLIFDYFDPILKKEIYNEELHEIYHLTSVILGRLEGRKSGTCELEKKIIKTISLIYILAQFEKLKPVAEEIVRIYSYSYSKEQIENALKSLIEKEYVIYLRQSNSYLKLKETSGVDIAREMHDEIERQKKSFALSDVLNENNDEKYFYPYRYNDEKEMTRFFEFRFVDFERLADFSKEDKRFSDGKFIAVICKSKEEIEAANDFLLKFSKTKKDCVFALLKKTWKIEKSASELNAIDELCRRSNGDEILHSEYQVVYDDLWQIVDTYIKKYTRPENRCCSYFYNGREKPIERRAELSELLSDICDKTFADSPVINNEAINKNDITQMAYNSRRKILAGLLRNPLEKNLGLTGNGQDVAIMRSSLLYVGLLNQSDGMNSEGAEIRFDFENDSFHLGPMIFAIQSFVNDADGRKKCFTDLYEKLVSKKYGIGARRGIIPIFVAAVLGRIKNQLALYHGETQVPINADNLSLLNDEPEDFYLLRFSLDNDKKSYLAELKRIFAAIGDSAEEICKAIQGWYFSLPKYSRELKTDFSRFMRILKEESGSQELIFVRIPAAVDSKKCDINCAEKIAEIKSFYDGLLSDLEAELKSEIKKIFGVNLHEWAERLPRKSFDCLYADGTESLLSLLRTGFKNESDFMEELAITATGLRLEDWGENTKLQFLERMKEWKTSAEKFGLKNEDSKTDSEFSVSGLNENSYFVSFPDERGNHVAKYFEKVDESPRAKLLFNKVTDALDTMGKSMSDAEKRQVLMDVLQKMCGGEI